MTNSEKRKYKVQIGVSYEKEVTVEAEDAYEAMSMINKALVNSDLIQFSGKDIYSFMAVSEPENAAKYDTDYCEVDADDFVKGTATVTMRLGDEGYTGKCRLDDDLDDEKDYSDEFDYDEFADDKLPPNEETD